MDEVKAQRGGTPPALELSFRRVLDEVGAGKCLHPFSLTRWNAARRHGSQIEHSPDVRVHSKDDHSGHRRTTSRHRLRPLRLTSPLLCRRGTTVEKEHTQLCPWHAAPHASVLAGHVDDVPERQESLRGTSSMRDAPLSLLIHELWHGLGSFNP